MEVQRQSCHACGGVVLQNLLLRQSGERLVVIVKCDGCGELVARYELSSYYHHGEGFEGWLRTSPVATESTIDLSDTYLSLKESAARELEQADAILKTGRKERPKEAN